MPVSTINRIKTIANRLNYNDSSIVTIYENSGLIAGNELIKDHKIISFNCFIKNLRAFSLINSLAQINLPNFTLEDSDTDKLYKTLDVEWGSARKQITLYISNQPNTNSTGLGWFKVGSLSLLNPSGYPYRIYNLMDVFTDSLALELGDNGKIGVQMEDVGFGLLDINDEVVIHGSYIEEIFVQSPEPKYVNIINSNSGTTPDPLPEADPFPVNSLFRISASSLQLSNNQLVQTWNQSQTSNFIVTQETESYKPIYKANVLNNKSAVFFDGLNKFLSIQQAFDSTASVQLLPVNSDWLLFIVGKFDDPATTLLSIFNPDLYQTSDFNITGNIYRNFLDEYGNYRQFFYENPFSTEWSITAINKIGNSLNVYVNGVTYNLSFDGSTPTYDITYAGKAFIGCLNPSANYLNGYVADIAIIGSHSNADINTIGNFYKDLYNLSWSNI